jgi:hypothetical protein
VDDPIDSVVTHRSTVLRKVWLACFAENFSLTSFRRT